MVGLVVTFVYILLSADGQPVVVEVDVVLNTVGPVNEMDMVRPYNRAPTPHLSRYFPLA